MSNISIFVHMCNFDSTRDEISYFYIIDVFANLSLLNRINVILEGFWRNVYVHIQNRTYQNVCLHIRNFIYKYIHMFKLF